MRFNPGISSRHRQMAIFAGLALSACVLAVRPAHAAFIQDNLVSDGSVSAAHIDPTLINPWGIAYSATSPFWISNNGTGLGGVYNGSGATVRAPVTVAPPPGSPPGSVATPTGQVFNSGGANDFVVSSGAKVGKAAFLFATEDGTISGWSPSVDAGQSIIAVNNSPGGAVYKGLAIGSNGGSNFLYAANFHSGNIEVYNASFAQVATFTDSGLPAGYAPFNVQTLGGHLFVTFALQDAGKQDDVAGAGNGFVDEFDLNGTLIKRVASNGSLNSPWGLALAPSQFGQYSGDLLVGNFGDGRINIFDLSGASVNFLGQLLDLNNAPIAIGDLWALAVGNGGPGSDPNAVYFTAGIEDEAHGLFGALSSVPEPGSLSLLGLAVAGMLAMGSRRRFRVQSVGA